MSSGESLVAFFDILGYKSFLKSNSATDAAEEIFKLIQEAPSAAADKWKAAEDKPHAKKWNKILDKVQKVVFSDTILVSIPLDTNKVVELEYALIIGIARKLTEELFKWGLPVRCTIARGQFLFKGTCIAGKAVVEAYELCEKLEFSGIALSPDLSKYIDDTFENVAFWNRTAPYYLCPLKNSVELKIRVSPWNCDAKDGNFTNQIRDSFWKWGKDIPSNVDGKIFNTAKLLDFFAHSKKEEELRKKSLSTESTFDPKTGLPHN